MRLGRFITTMSRDLAGRYYVVCSQLRLEDGSTIWRNKHPKRLVWVAGVVLILGKVARPE